jgi:hypothetical protein
MKRLVLTVLLCGVICNGTAHAMFKVLGRFWEDVKREATNAAHNTEKTVSKAWEDVKRESTNAANDPNVITAIGIGAGLLVKPEVNFTGDLFKFK